MRIEELRVGNLVMYRNVLCKILSIHSPQPMKDKRFSDKAYVDVWCNSVVSFLLSELEPILITEERLEEFGFVYDNDEGWNYDSNIGFSLSRSDDFVWYYFGNIEPFWTDIIPEIKYIHQLQNLCFSLGEELNLKD